MLQPCKHQGAALTYVFLHRCSTCMDLFFEPPWQEVKRCADKEPGKDAKHVQQEAKPSGHCGRVTKAGPSNIMARANQRVYQHIEQDARWQVRWGCP
jgi:hypothetical protein